MNKIIKRNLKVFEERGELNPLTLKELKRKKKERNKVEKSFRYRHAKFLDTYFGIMFLAGLVLLNIVDITLNSFFESYVAGTILLASLLIFLAHCVIYYIFDNPDTEAWWLVILCEDFLIDATNVRAPLNIKDSYNFLLALEFDKDVAESFIKKIHSQKRLPVALDLLVAYKVSKKINEKREKTEKKALKEAALEDNQAFLKDDWDSVSKGFGSND